MDIFFYILVYALFIGSLLSIIYQDFRFRSIHVGWLFLCMLTSYLIVYTIRAHTFLWLHFGLNIGFILLQLLLLTVYFSLKERKFVNITLHYLGWGDIVFFLGLALIFPPLQFVWFYTGSLLFVLLSFLGYQIIKKGKGAPTIPLAGGMGLTLLGYFLSQHL